ncbi:phosphatase PAP2 family protein [Streptomyces sp. NPDC015171]|uniref:phosphatase PAP2 family protein n=1 Tax=Streptomyces sp. NPDC015171 TaxID=3364945 RepID=UPI0036FA48C0
MNRRDVADVAGTVGLSAWGAFGLLTAAVVTGAGDAFWPDHSFLAWSVGHRPHTVVTLARGVTATGTGAIPYVLAVLAGLVAGRSARHRLLAAAVFASCLAAGQTLRHGVMELVRRARPPLTDWATHASGWAFPSGHATTAALTAGLLMVAVTLRAPRGATGLRLVIGCWGALVGLTRIYLGVHWFTDVVGGWLFAVGWLGVCLWAAARWLPGPFIAGTAPALAPGKDHAPQDPGH